MLTFNYDALSRTLTSGGPQATTSFQYDLGLPSSGRSGPH
jgi:hypothetical protein